VTARAHDSLTTATVVVALLFAQSGCAITGTYEPKPSRRIAPLDVAGRVYVREGRRYNVGVFGSAEDLVRGNDLAVAEARASFRKSTAGWLLYGIGTSLLATGIILDASRRTETPVETALILGSLVPLIASAPFIAGATVSRQNAVNIYNDSLEGPIDPHAFDEPPPPGGR
jgi:hypothetical protein